MLLSNCQIKFLDIKKVGRQERGSGQGRQKAVDQERTQKSLFLQDRGGCD